MTSAACMVRYLNGVILYSVHIRVSHFSFFRLCLLMSITHQDVRYKKTRMMGIQSGEQGFDDMSSHFDTIDKYDRGTDRQTDRQTESIVRCKITSYKGQFIISCRQLN